MTEDLRAADRLLALTEIKEALARYVFRPQNEDDLQAQVFVVLSGNPRLKCEREVLAKSGRYDVLVRHTGEHFVTTIVLELKLSGSAATVERQAQRYALTDGIDAVGVVTTSIRLGRRLLEGGDSLGGKPLHVIVLRTS